MKSNIVLSFALVLTLASTNLSADEALESDLGGFDTEEVANEASDDLAGFGEAESEAGDDLAGFGDDEALGESSEKEIVVEESMFSLSGNVAFKTSYGYIDHEVKANATDANGIDYSGFNQAQISTYLQLDGKLSDNWKMRISGDAFYDAIYDLNDENYNDDTIDAYQTQLRADDVYLQGRLTGDIDLKLGRQIVVWGKSDSIRITDVINPTDNRLPAMTDIEDLRLPTTMAKLDYYLGDWNFSGMVIGESRVLIEAAPRSEFFPVDSVFPNGAPDPFITFVEPDTSLDNIQYAFAANGVFSGWDLSFYAADVYDSKWHIEGSTPTTSKRVVSKIKMLGSAVNVATGSWLLKSEVALIDGVKYNSTTDEKSRLDALVGFDYMGIKDTVLSLELANRHIFDHEEQMSQIENVLRPDYVDENEVTTAMRATRSFANDSINASALVSMFGSSWEYGGFARVWVEYDVIDAVVANIGLVDYLDGDKPFTKAISDNDRIFADITYSF